MIHKPCWNWSTYVNQNYFKLVKILTQTLLKLTHKCYSKFIKISQNWLPHVAEIESQTLHKITQSYSNLIQTRYWNSPTKVRQNYLKLVKINPHTLLKLTNKSYSKLLKINQNWSKNVTQIHLPNYFKFVKIDRKALLKIT